MEIVKRKKLQYQHASFTDNEHKTKEENEIIKNETIIFVVSFVISFSKKEDPWVIGTEIKFTGTAFCSCLLLPCGMEHKKKSLQPRNKQTKCKEYNSDDISLKYLPCIYSGIYRIPESRLVEASILSQLLVRIDYKFRGSAGQKDNNKSKETIIVNKKCGIFVQRHAYENHRTKRFG